MVRVKVALGTFGAQDKLGGSVTSFIELAKAADAAGIDQIVFTDHVIMGDNTERYPYGPFPVLPEYPWFEPLTLLAKTIATLDQLANGRVDLGIGVGWQKEEYQSQGLDFGKRFQYFDDQLLALQQLWQQAPVQIDTPTVKMEKLYSLPYPKQQHASCMPVPLWFGLAPLAKNCERIANFGAGWIPISWDYDYIKSGADKIRDAMLKAGRDPETLQIRAHAVIDHSLPPKAALQHALDSVETLVKAGATIIEFETAPFIEDDDVEFLLEKVSALSANLKA